MNIEVHIIQPAIVGRAVDLTAPTTMVAGAFIGGAIAGVPARWWRRRSPAWPKQLFMEMRGRAAPEPLIDRRPGSGRAGARPRRSLLPRRRRDDVPPTDGPDAHDPRRALDLRHRRARGHRRRRAGGGRAGGRRDDPQRADHHRVADDVAPTTTAPPVPSRFVAPTARSRSRCPACRRHRGPRRRSDAFALGVGEDLVAVTRYPLDAFDGDPAPRRRPASTGCSTPRAPCSRNWRGSTRRCGRTRRRTSSTSWPSNTAPRRRCTAW